MTASLRRIFAVASREFFASLASPAAWVFLVIFLVMANVCTFVFSDILALGQAADLAPVEHDGARGRRVHAAEHVEHGGLAGTRRADDDAELAALDLEVHAIDGMDLHIAHTVRLPHVSELNERHAPPLSTPTTFKRTSSNTQSVARRPFS